MKSSENLERHVKATKKNKRKNSLINLVLFSLIIIGLYFFFALDEPVETIQLECLKIKEEKEKLVVLLKHYVYKIDSKEIKQYLIEFRDKYDEKKRKINDSCNDDIFCS